VKLSPSSRTRRALVLGAALFFGAVAVSSSNPIASAVPVLPEGLPNKEANTTRYIVRFAENVSESEITNLIEGLRGRNEKSKRAAKFSQLFNGGIYDLSPGLANRLGRQSGKVAWVEEDKNVELVLPSSVSAAGVQSAAPWGLDRIDQTDLPLNSSYSYASDGSGVTSYVVDTGILASHTDFGGRVRAGYDAFNGNTIDCNGHGTHVAGTIGGSIYGVAKATSLVAVRVLDCSGAGTLSGVVAGIDWAVNDHASGPAVMNLSLGGGASASLDSAVDRAIADGISVVVAAGNSNIDACTVSPARASNAITVGATTTSDSRASYSNFGSCLDVFAPGSSVLSAYHTSATATATLSGTSMASPHVAGAAARLLGVNPALRPDEVASAIIASATANKVANAGTNSPNRLLFAAPESASTPTTTAPATPTTTVPGTPTTTTPPTTTVPLTPPPAPVNVRAIGGNRSAIVSWQDGQDDGTLTHDHTVYVYRSGRLEKSVVVGDIPQTTITDLKANQSYTFRVQARNIIGAGPLSDVSNAVTPFAANIKRSDTVEEPGSDGSTPGATTPGTPTTPGDPSVPPSAPAKVSAKVSGKKLVLSWVSKRAVTTGTEFTVVIRYRGRVISRIPMGSTTELTLAGMSNDPRYTYRILAQNASGTILRSGIIRATSN
jgi:subtilisin family serine protease